MCEKLCLFAGTTEGRRLAEILHKAAELTVCVATEYGEVMLDGIEDITVHTGRMDADEMACFFKENGFTRIIDATHPYAAAVTENIRASAEAADLPVLRILREAEPSASGAVWVPDVPAARDWLAGRSGNIFLTTGAKELSLYAGLDMARVWARVLPTASSLDACRAAGIEVSHIIAAQGPFTEEINTAQMRMIGAEYMVTKASGKAGGFEEKLRASAAVGAVPVIIGRPPQVQGLSMDEALAELGKTLPLEKTHVAIVGIGPGAQDLLTARVREILQNCDALIGARSVVESCPVRKTAFFEFLPQKVRAVLDGHPSIRRAAVVMRGDTGFFSGTKNLLGALDGYDVSVEPGVSSAAVFAAALGVSWDDAALLSLHGRDGALMHTVRTNKKAFILTGGAHTPEEILKTLCDFGLGLLPAAVGERLSYPDQAITRGTAAELCKKTFDPLSILYIENENAARPYAAGIPDEEFIRGDTPMTKQEVRAVSMACLAPPSDAVVYDIGAGTGSVSIECALAACEGQVWAVEKAAEAIPLLEKNRRRFGTDNLYIVEGTAPEAMAGLPAPTHAFIGGSSGSLRGIVAALLEKNPDVRIVVNAVTLETQSEATACAKEFGFAVYETVSVQASRARKLGRYHMMTAQNPVSVITLQGGTLHA